MSNKTMNKAELQESIQDLNDRQEELQQLQLSNPEAFTAEEKAEFDSNAKELKTLQNRLTIVEAALAQNANAAAQNANAAAQNQTDENSRFVKLMIAFGNRFSRRTGKEINPPRPVSLSFGEWQLFKESYRRLGYEITEVINDPFGDAAALVVVPED